jgi:hypothetical protein
MVEYAETENHKPIRPIQRWEIACIPSNIHKHFADVCSKMGITKSSFLRNCIDSVFIRTEQCTRCIWVERAGISACSAASELSLSSNKNNSMVRIDGSRMSMLLTFVEISISCGIQVSLSDLLCYAIMEHICRLDACLSCNIPPDSGLVQKAANVFNPNIPYINPYKFKCKK